MSWTKGVMNSTLLLVVIVSQRKMRLQPGMSRVHGTIEERHVGLLRLLVGGLMMVLGFRRSLRRSTISLLIPRDLLLWINGPIRLVLFIATTLSRWRIAGIHPQSKSRYECFLFLFFLLD
jgi:hypothetical protein